ncbi:MAG: flagellar brake protein [Methylobacter sp.]|nr:flagellar brake protein [Methylobacter sp.]
MSDLSSFSVQNTKQIIYYLTILFKNKSLLSARFGANSESYITTLLEIDGKNNTVILDSGSKEDLNKHLLNASKIIFDTEYRGIKASFFGAGLKMITHKGYPAFSMPLPKVLFWMERREYFRVKVPALKPSYAQLVFEDSKVVNLKLTDVSLTGFAMLNISKEVSGRLVPGTKFSKCKLILSDVGEGMVSFETRAKYLIKSEKVQKVQKIGCKLIGITRPVEEIIQRYMQRVQQEDLQKE